MELFTGNKILRGEGLTSLSWGKKPRLEVWQTKQQSLATVTMPAAGL